LRVGQRAKPAAEATMQDEQDLLAPAIFHFALASQWSGIRRERLPNPVPLSAIVIL
jgi:hypothetical protein